MSILRGHEDLRPKAIVGFDMGFALVDCGEQGVKHYRLTVGAAGNLHAEPVEDKQHSLPDQLAPELRARRTRTVDQM